jgi:hypothetical protein
MADAEGAVDDGKIRDLCYGLHEIGLFEQIKDITVLLVYRMIGSQVKFILFYFFGFFSFFS